MAYDVAVVGGGISGLVAAYSLKKKGFSVLVLEKNKIPGGRMRTLTEGGFRWDAGAQFLTRGNDVIFGLIEELSMVRELVRIKPRIGIVDKDRLIYGRLDSPLTFFRIPGVSPAGRLKSLGIIKLMRKSLIDADSNSLESLARRELGQDVLENILGPVISSLFFWNAAETSGMALPLACKSLLQCRHPYALRGGLSTLPLAIAEQLEVRLQATVTDILPGPGGSVVEVIFKYPRDGGAVVEEVVKASRVILAVPAPRVLSLFSEAERIIGRETVRFFKDIQYSKIITLGLGLKSPADGNAFGICCPPAAGRPVSSIINENYKAPGRVPEGKGFSLIIASGSFSGSHFNSPGDIIKGVIYNELAKIYPGLTQKVEFTTLQRWQLAMPKFTVGYFNSLKSFRASQTGKLPFAFCGDYLTGPGVESAACSGLAAAEEVEKSLR